MNKRVLAFGNPLLDTIVSVKDQYLLNKYNLESDGQKEISLEEMTLLQEDINNYEATQSAGGCAQNTLRVLQWLCQKQFLPLMFGGIGIDEEGLILRELLRKDGVETSYILNKNYSTGRTISLVKGNSRSLVAYLGAAEVMPLNNVENNTSLKAQIQQADLIYMEGFFLTKRVEIALFILNYIKSLNKQFAFNLCGEYLCKENPEMVKYFISRANIIFGNRKEFQALISVMNETNAENLVKALGKEGKIVAMTNGSKPVLSIGALSRDFIETEVNSLNVDIVDTTGAGDAFVAGFLTGHLMEKSLSICTELGCYAAQEIITRRGCAVPDYPPKFEII